jgi:hypothetical protein
MIISTIKIYRYQRHNYNFNENNHYNCLVTSLIIMLTVQRLL